MKYHPNNTLAYLLQHPTLIARNWGGAPVPQLAQNIRAFKTQHQLATPETSALTFYAMNHLVGLIRQHFSPYEPLPDWAVHILNDYTGWLSSESQRMVSYLTLITTRESRHLSGSDKQAVFAGLPTEAYEFFKKIEGGSPTGTIDRFFKSPPNLTIAEHIGAHVQVFNKGKWGASFGGKKWGVIADTLHRCILGLTSLEVMIDTSWTLAHNGGPMFNKGMLYQMYDHADLLAILDVQRSGQIPELILSDLYDQYKLPSFVKIAIGQVSDFLTPIANWVDWQKVEDLGAKGKYTEFKKLQPVKPVAGLIKQVEVLPGVYVPSLDRIHAKKLETA